MIKNDAYRTLGSQSFGSDPASYDAARPAYPSWVFHLLRERCGHVQDLAAFEIGAGSGTATRQLLRMGIDRLVAVEPDERFAAFLRGNNTNRALTVVAASFEEVLLKEAGFDLGLSATAFHWLDENSSLRKVAKLLRAGGWWAMLWNVFGDPALPDAFHEATRDLLGPPFSDSDRKRVPFALDTAARLAALKATNCFDNLEHQVQTWSLVLNPDEVVALYATYSNVIIRPDREHLLGELHRVAREDFQGVVTRNVVTSLYLAQRQD